MKNLKQVRQSKGLCLREVAKKSGVSLSYISEIECGKKNPTVPVALKLADALDVSILELIGERKDGDKKATVGNPTHRNQNPKN